MIRSLGLFAALVFVPAVKAAEDTPKDIIAKAIKAHGGEEVLTKNKAMTTKNKGTINIPGVGEAAFEQEVSAMLPDKFKDLTELTIAGQKVTVLSIGNGDKLSITITAGGKDMDAGDKAKDALKDALYTMKVARLVTLVTEKGYELSAIGEDKVNDKPVIGVRVSAKGKKDVSLYFDKKTYLLTKIAFQTTDPASGNEISEERIIGEYQKTKEGLPVPKKVLVKHDGKTFLEAEVLEMKFLEKIDDSEFKK